MTNIGIKISKPGVDVKIADDKDLVWSSNFKTLKIYRILKFTSSGSQAHGLDYAPSFTVCNINANQFFGFGRYYASVDATSVYSGPVYGQDVYVILFIDPLNE